MVEAVTTFYELLLADHRRTEALLTQLAHCLQTGESLEAIQALFKTLSDELDCHFACEEHGLFPVLSLYKTMILMEVEHDDLLRSREGFQQCLLASLEAQSYASDLLSTFQTFQEMLQRHIK